MRSLDGWKTVIGYVATTLIEALQSGDPMLIDALRRALTRATPLDILEAVAQILLAVGVAHRAVKQVRGGE